MNYYDALKFIHVLMAVFWVGSGASLAILAFKIQREQDGAHLVRLGRDSAWLGQRVLAPASLVLLIAGILMVIEGFPEFQDLWIVLGIVGFLTTLLTGILYLGPTADRLATLAEEKGTGSPDVRAAIDRLLFVARLDLLVLFLVIFDMTIKPGA
jgi:uncharacterized membrane protein